MNAFTPTEALHRLVKQAMDSGAVSTLTEAESLLRGYRVCFSIDAAEAARRSHQIALLTGVALARRIFLGGAKEESLRQARLTAIERLGAHAKSNGVHQIRQRLRQRGSKRAHPPRADRAHETLCRHSLAPAARQP
jgi:hypothetical protein